MLGTFGHTASVVLYYGSRVAGFPHDRVPDGTIVAPHHYVTGLLVAAFAVYLVSGDDGKKPYTVAGMAVSAFAWVHLWAGPSPFLGAVGTLLGVLVALWAVVAGPRWSDAPWVADDGGRLRRWLTPRTVAAVGLLVALDDVVEHAFGVWTPLDGVWAAYLYRWLGEAVRWLATAV